jgi:hypothetical protein
MKFILIAGVPNFADKVKLALVFAASIIGFVLICEVFRRLIVWLLRL